MTSGQRLGACDQPCCVIVGSPQASLGPGYPSCKARRLGLLDLEGPHPC